MDELVRLGRLYTAEEFKKANNEAMEQGYWNTDILVFPPGAGFYQPWYYTPGQPVETARIRLNPYYLKSAYKTRPPLILITPNGHQWCVDQMSSNGNGWEVTGEWPNITCRPSIVVDGYHGWLTNGVFSEDLEKRGPRGIVPVRSPRPGGI